MFFSISGVSNIQFTGNTAPKYQISQNKAIIKTGLVTTFFISLTSSINNQVLAFCICLFLFSPLVHAQTDRVVLNNSDVLIGEIKIMEKNILIFETPYSSSDFEIEWDKVREIYSKRNFFIYLSSGLNINAVINSDTSEFYQVTLSNFNGVLHVPISEVVYINPVEEDFLSNLEASLDFGYNYTKSNNLQQTSLKSKMSYTSNNWLSSISVNAVRSSQDSVDATRRTDADVNYNYFLKRRYFLLVSSELLQNEEQKLALRSATRMGLGNYIVRTNSWYLGVAGGGVYNGERFTDDSPNRNSAEAFAGAEANLYEMGDLDLLTTFLYYPSLTEQGRHRIDFEFDIKYDLPLDFYISLRYTLNFDNQPVSGASKSDFVLQTSIGWEL